MDFSFDDSNLTFYLLIEDMSSDDSAEFFGDFTIDSSGNLVGSVYLIEDTNKTTPLITVTPCQFAGMSFYDIESATYLVTDVICTTLLFLDTLNKMFNS